jgi:hypothetical protein
VREMAPQPAQYRFAGPCERERRVDLGCRRLEFAADHLARRQQSHAITQASATVSANTSAIVGMRSGRGRRYCSKSPRPNMTMAPSLFPMRKPAESASHLEVEVLWSKKEADGAWPPAPVAALKCEDHWEEYGLAAT